MFLSSLSRKEAPKFSPFSNHFFTNSLETDSFELGSVNLFGASLMDLY